MKNFIYLVLTVFFIAGCASPKEAAKGFLGVSTKILEDKRADAITKVFNLDFQSCYSKANEAIKAMSAYVYARDPGNDLIAVYVSETDTTPVGIFIVEKGPAITEIQISSPSSAAKELVADKLFYFLENGKLKEEEKNKEAGKIDSKLFNK